MLSRMIPLTPPSFLLSPDPTKGGRVPDNFFDDYAPILFVGISFDSVLPFRSMPFTLIPSPDIRLTMHVKPMCDSTRPLKAMIIELSAKLTDTIANLMAKLATTTANSKTRLYTVDRQWN